MGAFADCANSVSNLEARGIGSDPCDDAAGLKTEGAIGNLTHGHHDIAKAGQVSLGLRNWKATYFSPDALTSNSTSSDSIFSADFVSSEK